MTARTKKESHARNDVSDICDGRDVKDIHDMPYRIKWNPRGKRDEAYFARVEQYGRDTDELWKKREIALIDPLDGTWGRVPIDAIEYVEQKHGWHRDDEQSEYDIYMDEQFEEHKRISKEAGKGVKVGKLFSICIADGRAWYVITKVNKKSVRIEWRGFCGDSYIDPTLGWGGSFPTKCIEPHIGWDDTLSEIFK